MRLLTVKDGFQTQLTETAVTIGNFDGVHRGHAELFRHLKDRSARLGLPTVVVTFEPHPLAVLAPEAAPPLITTFPQKAELIEQAGIDYLAVIKFSREFSQIAAESFVRNFLCGAFGMRHIIIGHDYAFGRDRLGNFETLADIGAECCFSIEDIEPFGEDGKIYSSSLARRLIGSGAMPEAAAILGRYHVISGRVVRGREIGSRIGFPTANIVTDNELIPPDGVYAVMVSVGGQLIKGACNIGKNPTFESNKRTIEVFLLDYSGQLYDSTLAVCFVRHLRDVRKFPDTETLIQAISQDVAVTRTVLATVANDMIKPLLGQTNWSVE
jgi:riboflavin kinase/FMN adenylyltransferase